MHAAANPLDFYAHMSTDIHFKKIWQSSLCGAYFSKKIEKSEAVGKFVRKLRITPNQ